MSKDFTDKQLTAYIKTMPSASFKNEHGEKFTIHSNGLTVWISGDEVNAMVDPKKTVMGYLPLFTSAFSIWSKEELYLLGKALQELFDAPSPSKVGGKEE